MTIKIEKIAKLLKLIKNLTMRKIYSMTKYIIFEQIFYHKKKIFNIIYFFHYLN